MNRFFSLIIIALTFCVGCDLVNSSEFRSEIVISGFLAASGPLPEIRVTRTVPIGDPYDGQATAIRDAQVLLQRIDASDEVIDEYVYEYVEQSNGLYRYVNTDTSFTRMRYRIFERVRPLQTYRLRVDVPDHPTITSTTLVPDTFSVSSVSSDTVTFQSDDPFTFEVTPPHYPGRQSYFIFTTTALDGFEDQLTPFARSLLDDGDDVTLADLRERVSPILNEESFDLSAGALRIQFPWLAIYFYGRNRVSMQALDDNLYDFIRSQNVQQGGSTRPPGEIPNVLDPIEGGRGIFGSYAEAAVEFYVRPPDE